MHTCLSWYALRESKWNALRQVCLIINVWRTVLGSTLGHVIPHQHTDQHAQQRPPLLSVFPHHARMGIKGRPESRERAVRPGWRAGSHRSVALDERSGDASPGGYSHRKVSPAPSDFLVEPERALANGHSHGQFSVRDGTLLQVPQTRCCSGFTRMWQPPPTGPIPRGCRVEHRRMGSPMVGFRHGPGISFRCTWLTPAPTSLGEDDTPEPEPHTTANLIRTRS